MLMYYCLFCRLKMAMKSKKPFGKLHVVLAGDFYQMKNCGFGSSIVESLDRLHPGSDAWKGCKLLYENITNYIVLMKNCRALMKDPSTQEV